LIEQTGVIGEKLEIRTFDKLEGAFVGSYIHSGNKIATLVALSKILKVLKLECIYASGSYVSYCFR
jgi:translation elongation factor EF-Ts